MEGMTMLKRITSIQNIGKLTSLRAARVQFSKVTLIYGENSQGKSTLVHILRALAEGDTSSITRRKSIPPSGGKQEVEINFVAPGATSESPARYIDGKWSSPIVPGVFLRVFDDGFYHRNVFDNRTFSRETKEGLTSFVLGPSGVAKAAEIKVRTDERDSQKRQLDSLKAGPLAGIQDLPAFLAAKPSSTEPAINAEIASEQNRLTDLQSRHKGHQQIASRPLPALLVPSWGGPSGLIEQLVRLLTSSLSATHAAARDRVLEHIRNHCSHENDALNWFRLGLDLNNGSTCQFCGRLLDDGTKTLLEMYRTFFDADYAKQERLLRETLPGVIAEFSLERTAPIVRQLSANDSVLAAYPELHSDTRFSEAFERLSTSRDSLLEAVRLFESESNPLTANVVAAGEAKKVSPHEPIVPPDSSQWVQAWEQIVSGLSCYNECLTAVDQHLQIFKKSSTLAVIEAEIKSLTDHLAQLQRSLKRLHLDATCKQAVSLEEGYKLAQGKIESLRDELAKEQAAFLTKYFASLNAAFKRFGSPDFALDLGQSNIGKQPVIFLRVKYRGRDIPESDIDSVFSESDRRALAFSVFWAQIENEAAAVRGATILVLDDPVTSFDEHRISAINAALSTMARDVAQIIVVSHYRIPLIRFMQAHSGGLSTMVLELCQMAGVPTLSILDSDEFVLDDHRLNREKLFLFADTKTNTIDVGILRVFFEHELDLRMRQHFGGCMLSVGTLSDRIETLARTGAFSSESAKLAHSWRERLNPNHHSWLTGSIEDKRQTTQEFLNYIYNSLSPARSI